MSRLIRKISALAILLGTASAYAATTQIQVLSATVKDQKIAGATVILQKNGTQSVGTTSDERGSADMPIDVANDSGTLLIVKKAGYSDLVVKCPCGGAQLCIEPRDEKP